MGSPNYRASPGLLVQLAYDDEGGEITNKKESQQEQVRFHHYGHYDESSKISLVEYAENNEYPDSYMDRLLPGWNASILTDVYVQEHTRTEIGFPYLTIIPTLQTEKRTGKDFDLMHRNQHLFGTDDCLGILNYCCNTLEALLSLELDYGELDFDSIMSQEVADSFTSGYFATCKEEGDVSMDTLLTTTVMNFISTMQTTTVGTDPNTNLWEFFNNPHSKIDLVRNDGSRQWVYLMDLFNGNEHEFMSSITQHWLPWTSQHTFSTATFNVLLNECGEVGFGVQTGSATRQFANALNTGNENNWGTTHEYASSTHAPSLHHTNLKTLTDLFSSRLVAKSDETLKVVAKNLKSASLHRVVVYLMHDEVKCYRNTADAGQSATYDPMRYTWDRKLRVKVFSGTRVVYDRYVQGWCKLAQRGRYNSRGPREMLPVPYQIVVNVPSGTHNSGISVEITASEPFQCFQTLQTLCDQQEGGMFTLNLNTDASSDLRLCQLTDDMAYDIEARCGVKYVQWLRGASTDTFDTEFELLYSLQGKNIYPHANSEKSQTYFKSGSFGTPHGTWFHGEKMAAQGFPSTKAADFSPWVATDQRWTTEYPESTAADNSELWDLDKLNPETRMSGARSGYTERELHDQRNPNAWTPPHFGFNSRCNPEAFSGQDVDNTLNFGTEQQFCSARSNGRKRPLMNMPDDPTTFGIKGTNFMEPPSGGNTGCPVTKCCKPGCIGIAFDGACSAATADSYKNEYHDSKKFKTSHIRADHTCKISTQTLSHQTNKRLETLYDIAHDYRFASESGRGTINHVNSVTKNSTGVSILWDEDSVVQKSPHVLSIDETLTFSHFTGGNMPYGKNCENKRRSAALSTQASIPEGSIEEVLHPTSALTDMNRDNSVYLGKGPESVGSSSKPVTYETIFWGGTDSNFPRGPLDPPVNDNGRKWPSCKEWIDAHPGGKNNPQTGCFATIESLIKESQQAAGGQLNNFDESTVHNLFDTAQYEKCKIDTPVDVPAGFSFKLPPLLLSRVTFPVGEGGIEASVQKSVRAKDLFRRSGNGGLAYEFDMMQVQGFGTMRGTALPEMQRFAPYMNGIMVEDLNRTINVTDQSGPFQRMVSEIESIMDDLPDNFVCAPRASTPHPNLESDSLLSTNNLNHDVLSSQPISSEDIMNNALATQNCLTAMWSECSIAMQSYSDTAFSGKLVEGKLNTTVGAAGVAFFKGYEEGKCNTCWDKFFRETDETGKCEAYVAAQFSSNSDQNKVLTALSNRLTSNQYLCDSDECDCTNFAHGTDSLLVRDIVCTARKSMCAAFDNSIASHMNENFMYPNFLSYVQKYRFQSLLEDFIPPETKKMMSSVFRGIFVQADCGGDFCVPPKLEPKLLPLRSAGWVVGDSGRDFDSLTVDNTKLKLTRLSIATFLGDADSAAHCLNHLPRPVWSMMLPGTYSTTFMTETCPVASGHHVARLPGADANTRKQRRRVWAYFRPQSSGRYSFKLLAPQTMFALSKHVRVRVSTKIPDAYTKIGGRNSWMFSETKEYLDGGSYATKPSKVLFDMRTLINYEHFAGTRTVVERDGDDDKAMFRDYLDPLNDYHRYWCKRELAKGKSRSVNRHVVEHLCYGATNGTNTTGTVKWLPFSTFGSGAWVNETDTSKTNMSESSRVGDHIVENCVNSKGTRCGKGTKLQHVIPPDRLLIADKTRRLFELIKMHTNVGTTDGCDFDQDGDCKGNVTITVPERIAYQKMEIEDFILNVTYNTSANCLVTQTENGTWECLVGESIDTGKLIYESEPLPDFLTYYSVTEVESETVYWNVTKLVNVTNQQTNVTIEQNQTTPHQETNDYNVTKQYNRTDLVKRTFSYPVTRSVTHYRAYEQSCARPWTSSSVMSTEGLCFYRDEPITQTVTANEEDCRSGSGFCTDRIPTLAGQVVSRATCEEVGGDIVNAGTFVPAYTFWPNTCNGQPWYYSAAECNATVGTCSGETTDSSNSNVTLCNGEAWSGSEAECHAHTGLCNTDFCFDHSLGSLCSTATKDKCTTEDSFAEYCCASCEYARFFYERNFSESECSDNIQLGKCGAHANARSLFHNCIDTDDWVDLPTFESKGVYKSGVSEVDCKEICEPAVPSTLITKNISYDAEDYRRRIADYLAVHLPSQDLFMEANEPVLLSSDEVYKVELSFEYFGANNLTDLSFVGDSRFRAAGFESEIYEDAVADATRALDNNESTAMFGFDIRASFMGNAGDTTPFADDDVAFSLNERICTSDSAQMHWTSPAHNMRISRYDSTVVKKLAPVNFPNQNAPGQRPGVYHGMQSDKLVPCITGFSHSEKINMIGSNTVTQNYKSHNHDSYDAASDNYFAKVRRDREAGAYEAYNFDRRALEGDADAPWSADSGWAEWAKSYKEKNDPPTPEVPHVAMNITEAFADAMVHVKDVLLLMKEHKPEDVYKTKNWDTVRRHKFQPELVHQIRNGMYPEGDGLCDDIFRLAGGLDPSEMSNVESTAWHGCAMFVLGNASIDARSQLLNASALPGVGWFVRHAVKHGEMLVNTMASRAMQSFQTRYERRERETSEQTDSLLRLLNASLVSERRNLRSAWRSRSNPRKGITVNIPARKAQGLISEYAPAEESDETFVSNYNNAVLSFHEKWVKAGTNAEHKLLREAGDYISTMTFDGLKSAMRDATRLSRISAPLIETLSNASSKENEYLSAKYPSVKDWLVRTTRSVLSSQPEKIVLAEPGEYFTGAINTAKKRIEELGFHVAGSSGTSSLADSGTLQTETVRKLARSVLDMTDAKSYLLDAMNVQIPGVAWTDPTPRREWRHDSKLHSPFGRVVRGVMSGVFPEHFAYEDHDSTTKWVSDMLKPTEGLVTKNLSRSDFAHAAMLVRHRPHMRLGDKLASGPDSAAITMEKLAILMEAVEGPGYLDQIHPKAAAVGRMGARRELAEKEVQTRRRLSQDVDGSLLDAVRPTSHPMISVANAADTLDKRVQDFASRECTIGGEKNEFTTNCGFGDVFDPGGRKQECIGCSTCLGCELRPPTCGGLGRGQCSSDRECLGTRHCDVVSCTKEAMTEETTIHIGSQGVSHAEYCTEGPHYYDHNSEGTSSSQADAFMKDLEGFMFGTKAHCGLPAQAGETFLSTPSRRATCKHSATYCELGLFTHKGRRAGANAQVMQFSNFRFIDPTKITNFCTESSVDCDRFKKTETYTAMLQWAMDVGDGGDSHHSWFFDNVMRDCTDAKVGDGAAGVPYAMITGSTTLTRSDSTIGGNPLLGRWMSPLRLPHQEGSHEGYSCPCVRPSNEDGEMEMIGSWLDAPEACVCGDFADQPAYDAIDLGLNKNTLSYSIYNGLLCNLYLNPEHMCFPSIPVDLPTIPTVSWDIRSWLVRHEVRYTCENGDEAENAASAPQICEDDEVRVELACVACGYRSLVFKPTPWLFIPRQLHNLVFYKKQHDEQWKHPEDIDGSGTFGPVVPYGVYARLRNAWTALRFLMRWPTHQSIVLYELAELLDWCIRLLLFPLRLVFFWSDNFVIFEEELATAFYFPVCTEMEDHLARSVNTFVKGHPHVSCFSDATGITDECKASDFPVGRPEAIEAARQAYTSYRQAGYTCASMQTCGNSMQSWAQCDIHILEDEAMEFDKLGDQISNILRETTIPPLPGPATLCFIANVGSLFTVAIAAAVIQAIVVSFWSFFVALAEPAVYPWKWVIAHFVAQDLITVRKTQKKDEDQDLVVVQGDFLSSVKVFTPPCARI
jgi:hypothetical protein